MNTNVKLVGVGGGYSYGPAGATHHAIEDVAIMRSLPGMKVCCPGDPIEAKAIVTQSAANPGPMYIRLGKNNEPTIHEPNDIIEIGKSSTLRRGSDFALVVMGNMLEQGAAWVKEWVSEGFDPEFVSMHTVKPVDETAILGLVNRGMGIVTLEEHSVIGGLGSAVCEIVARSGSGSRVHTIGIPDLFSHYVGGQSALRKHYGLLSRPDLRSIGMIE